MDVEYVSTNIVTHARRDHLQGASLVPEDDFDFQSPEKQDRDGHDVCFQGANTEIDQIIALNMNVEHAFILVLPDIILLYLWW